MIDLRAAAAVKSVESIAWPLAVVMLKANLVGNAAPQLGGVDLEPSTVNMTKPLEVDRTEVTLTSAVDEAWAADPANAQSKAAAIATIFPKFPMETGLLCGWICTMTGSLGRDDPEAL
ncbi:hypothetical protein [Caulobacter sp. LARHSG274]